ncbi:hypothetical protein HDZ31DRAFT_45287 [Schizophyllum fasciatum]
MPYSPRTRIDKEAISGIEQTSVRICGIITYALFPDKDFPVAPSEFIGGLDGITYSIESLHWLMDYPSLDLLPGDRERAMATFLNRFARLCWTAYSCLEEPLPDTPRQWVATCCPRIMPDGSVERVPGLALVEAGIDAEWRATLCDVQMVPTEDRMSEAVYRLSTGAANIFERQEDRVYQVGLAIAGDMFQLVYHDRAGRVLSDVYSVHANPLHFVRIILGLTLLAKSYCGKDATIICRGEQRFVVVGRVEYKIVETLSVSRDVCGSGTICWRCRRDGIDEDFVIKNIWADTTRAHTEGELLQIAKSLDGVPDCLCEQPVLRPNGQPWTTTWLCDMIPHAPRRSGPKLALRRLVLQPYARPLEDFSDKDEFLGAFRDAIVGKCIIQMRSHQKLYDRFNTLHCDISENNIMLRPRSGQSRRQGLLIDLDLVRYPSHEQCLQSISAKAISQGTVPFMACDILQFSHRVRHGPWHDLESFLYVLMYMCVRYSGPSNTPRRNFDIRESPMAPWLAGDGDDKEKVMYRYEDEEFRAFLDSVFDPYFDDLKDLVVDLRATIMQTWNSWAHHHDVLQVLDRHLTARTHQRAPAAVHRDRSSSPAEALEPSAKRRREHASLAMCAPAIGNVDLACATVGGPQSVASLASDSSRDSDGTLVESLCGSSAPKQGEDGVSASEGVRSLKRRKVL